MSRWSDKKDEIEKALLTLVGANYEDETIEEAQGLVYRAALDLVAYCEAADAAGHYSATEIDGWDSALCAQSIIDDLLVMIERLRKVQHWSAARFAELGVRFDPLMIMLDIESPQGTS